MLIDFEKVVSIGASASSRRAFLFEPKDLVHFETAWEWQREWQKYLLEEAIASPAVWLLQHQNCYTLGRGASELNLLFNSKEPPHDLYRIDRGGEVTYHLPGQLVVYLVLDLRNYQLDLDWYLRQLEQVLIDVLEALGLQGEQIPGLTGLWLDGRKVAAIGIGCRRWVTQHGLALNVNCELKGFDQIIPCGLRGERIACLNQWIQGLTVDDVQPIMRKCLGNRFNLEWISEDFH